MEQTEVKKALGTVNQALEVAQKKGAFSLRDSANIIVALDTLNRFHFPKEDPPKELKDQEK